MHWKETLIKSEQIKWKKVAPKNIEDGRLDFTHTLSLTNLFENQAKTAFANGMLTMLQFHIQSRVDNKPIEVNDLAKLFNGCGLPEIAKQFELLSSSSNKE